MAIGVVAGTPVGAASTSNVTSISVSAPALTATEMHVISVGVNAGTPTIATPTGYSLLGNTALSTSSTSSLYVFYRMGVASSGTVTLTAGSAGRIAAVPFKVTGVDTTTPIEGTASTATSLTAPSKTVVDGDLLITCYAVREGVGAVGTPNTFTITPAAGMTEIGDVVSAVDNNTTQVATEAAYLAVGAGSTGTKTATTNATATALGGSLSFVAVAGATTTTHAASASLGVTANRAAGARATYTTATANLGVSAALVSAVNVDLTNPIFRVTSLNTDTSVTNPVPNAPGGIVVTEGDARLDISWDAAVAEVFPVTAYNLTLTAPGELTQTGSVQATEERLFTFTGLTNDVEYTVSIEAVNDNGTGLAGTATGTPVAAPVAPSVPQNVTATGLNRAVLLTWTAPADVGTAALLGYDITVVQPDETPASTTIDAGTTTATLTGLTNDVAATVTIAARSSAGSSSAVIVLATPTAGPSLETPPGAVNSLLVTALSGGARVSWTPPNDAGTQDIDGYLVTAEDDLTLEKFYYAVDASTVAINLSGLDNDRAYEIFVSAQSLAGVGQPVSALVTPSSGSAPVGYPYIEPSEVPIFEPSVLVLEPVVEVVEREIPAFYAFPPGAVFGPVNAGKKIGDETVVY